MVRVLATTLLWSSLAGADEPVLVGPVRAGPSDAGTRVTLELSGPAEHTVFSLADPDRVVLDLRSARLSGGAERIAVETPHLAGVRAAPRPGGDLRLVLDLKRPARPRTFLLKPQAGAGHRLVVELAVGASVDTRGLPVGPAAQPSAPALRDVVVVIDPGHGGVDPGAVGPGGTQEKRVTLAIARELETLIRRERGMRAVLTRSRDVFVPLRKRMAIARARGADLFVSIHADAFQDPRASGASVYALSANGASSEAARWLADRENAADLVGGVRLDDKDDVLASVLLDLSQTGTIEASLKAGRRVLTELGQAAELHKSTVQQAGFMVLKAPDIPSILVETAFISNPDEERRLLSAAYHKQLARAVLGGVRAFFAESAPPGALLAARRHVIARGESVASVAARYQVSPQTLRAVNGLAGDALPVGKVLTIPVDQGS
jgi:N-acetylmuramoyl-L-alanine amidase